MLTTEKDIKESKESTVKRIGCTLVFRFHCKL